MIAVRLENDIIKRAIWWGLAAMLLHRIVLQVWMGGVWWVIGENMLDLPSIQQESEIAPRPSPDVWERTTLEIWLRWDAVQYMKIAREGYTDERYTAFHPGYPYATHAMDQVIPGPVGWAGLVVSSLSLWAACSLLYLLMVIYFQSEQAAQWAIVAWLLYPPSFVLSSLHTESLFVALCLGSLYAQLQCRWIVAGILGAGAVFTRNQGIAMLAPLGWIVLESVWQERRWQGLARAIPLLLLPATVWGFYTWRTHAGFMPINDLLAEYNHIRFYLPPQGFLIEFQSLFKNPDLGYYYDLAGIIISGVVLIAMVWVPRYRIPMLLWYGWGLWLTMGTKVNYYPDVVPSIQSALRYSVTIMPVFMVLGDQLAQRGRFWRLSLLGIGGFITLLVSAMSALYVWVP